MKPIKSIAAALFTTTCLFSSAQTTVTFQPGASGKDAVINNCISCGYSTQNYGNTDELSALAWTNNSAESDSRSLLAFDLTSIPSNAMVTGASLSLYNNPNPSSGNLDGQHSNMSGSNTSYLRKVTQSWDESTVTWNTQPYTTTSGQLTLPASMSGNQDYTNLNVTALVQDMVTNPSQNFGFMLQLVTESSYRGLIFASGDHPNIALHPRLVITFVVPADRDTCVTFRPKGTIGVDACIANCIECGFVNNNYGDADEFSAIAWTNGGNQSNTRSLIQFDLTSIPTAASVSSAKLSLYQNPNPASGNMNGQHSTLSGANTSYLRRITSAWDEHLVTWSNQPGTTTTDQVMLPPSTSGNEDYLDIDMTTMVQNMVTNPGQNFGMMMQVANETSYRGLLFASSDHSNSNLHPKLEVCYSIPVNGIEEQSLNSVRIYPNPNRGLFQVAVSSPVANGRVYIFDLNGQILHEEAFAGNQQSLNVELSTGLYLLKITDGQQVYTTRITVE